LTIPIFAGGRVQANVEIQRGREEQALIGYRATVLRAFKEVEDALVTLSKEQDRLKELELGVEANRQAVTLANQLFTEGLADFLDVLESQRSLFAAEAQLARSRGEVSKSVVTLYKALGGGWEGMLADPAEEQTVEASDASPRVASTREISSQDSAVVAPDEMQQAQDKNRI
jgi:outer membrane protein, multidrug efflux system